MSKDGQLVASSSPNETILWRKDGMSYGRLKGRSVRFGSVAMRSLQMVKRSLLLV
ncbi:MAG: hypothetical protein KME52_03440 [Desmonostoc geniculatum HA4340-LM1]|nr:hypothetical protein [Desmonostoc geniculatum HA4340-LM1]